MQQDNIYKYIARSFVFGGAILAAYISITGQSDTLVTQPSIGFMVAFLLFVMSFSFHNNLLLRLTLAFLTGILVNQAMLNSSELSIKGITLVLLWHLPVLALFFMAYYLIFRKRILQAAEIIGNHLIAVLIVSLHMVVLSILLSKTFGFGYEKSLQVLINLIVFSLSISALISLAADKVIFCGLSFILGCYFLGIFIILPRNWAMV